MITDAVLQMDAIKRTCTVSAISGNWRVQLIMSFPAAYPNNAVPGFEFTPKTTLDKEAKTNLIRVNSSSQALSCIGRASLVLILRDVTRFMPLLARLVQ